MPGDLMVAGNIGVALRLRPWPHTAEARRGCVVKHGQTMLVIARIKGVYGDELLVTGPEGAVGWTCYDARDFEEIIGQ